MYKVPTYIDSIYIVKHLATYNYSIQENTLMVINRLNDYSCKVRMKQEAGVGSKCMMVPYDLGGCRIEITGE
jgi:hypothetical protein